MRKVASTLVAMTFVTAIAVSLSAVGIAASVSKTRLANPDAGLTDAQRLAKHTANTDAFQAKYRSWLHDFVVSGKDAGSLPRSHILALFEGPAPNLITAVRQADLIVVGVAHSVRFEPGPLSFLEFAVKQTLKGSAPAMIEVRQLGGPEPEPDFIHGVLAEADNAPLLLPGDRATLFLRQTSISGTPAYYVESYTGTYFLTHGWVKAVDGNPFKDQVNIEPEQMFTGAVARLAQ